MKVVVAIVCVIVGYIVCVYPASASFVGLLYGVGARGKPQAQAQGVQEVLYMCCGSRHIVWCYPSVWHGIWWANASPVAHVWLQEQFCVGLVQWRVQVHPLQCIRPAAPAGTGV